jgi:hypothetical protein
MGVNIVNWTRGLGQLRQTDSEVEASFKKTNVFPRPRIRLLFQRVVSPLGPRIGRFCLYWICSNPPAGVSLQAPFCQSTVCTESTLHCLVSLVSFSSHTKRLGFLADVDHVLLEV